MMNDNLKNNELKIDDLDEVNGGLCCTGAVKAMNTVQKGKKGSKKSTAKQTVLKSGDKSKFETLNCKNSDVMRA